MYNDIFYRRESQIILNYIPVVKQLSLTFTIILYSHYIILYILIFLLLFYEMYHYINLTFNLQE